ncbi:MAG: aminoacetone oxidase family FAD-binding enzyme [Oscillospiraceae bacterium]|nr:aminoacetone oxidase family FAD-binding enzyme [Oscillospiraceae bacterium]
MESVLVIGGGASGLMAALTAAEDENRRVTLLERQQRVGRKLLSTGNGRCNLTNLAASSPAHYHGADPAFVLPALRELPPTETLALFRSFGLLTVTEDSGRVYPLSDSASSVLDVLRFQIAQRGVELKTASPARALRREGGRFLVELDGEALTADALIVACGGAAGAKLGGVSDGYELLRPLGHRRTALYPALVQLVTEPDYPRALKGVRADAALSLRRGRERLAEAEGELQFTERGVSGPAVFELSRAAAAGGEGLKLHADFLRTYGPENVEAMLSERVRTLPGLEASELLTGLLHNRLGKMLLKYSGVELKRPVGTLRPNELRHVAAACKDFALPVRGTEGFDQAQVTAGGLRTADFDPRTLQSRLCPGLYVCGELLDIDGDCGGYNLQWAWASGRLAGRLLR